MVTVTSGFQSVSLSDWAIFFRMLSICTWQDLIVPMKSYEGLWRVMSSKTLNVHHFQASNMLKNSYDVLWWDMMCYEGLWGDMMGYEGLWGQESWQHFRPSSRGYIPRGLVEHSLIGGDITQSTQPSNPPTPSNPSNPSNPPNPTLFAVSGRH